MKQNRRNFLKTVALGTAAGLTAATADAAGMAGSFYVNSTGRARMRLRFFPYELKLRHVFTVSSYSRTTTPDVQVEIEYDGFTGYGEASMPQYLGQTVASVSS